MKIKTIKRIIYGTFITGALVMFLPLFIFTHSDYLTAFMYIGGAFGACGLIFCLICLLCPGCRACQNIVVFGDIPSGNCPHCGGELT